MPNAQPPTPTPGASGKNDEGPRVPDFFPPVGNFNAVVPLSEIDADSGSRVTAPAPMIVSRVIRATSKVREHDEHEETTLVPARAARKAKTFRRATPRPSWPVMIMALVLSLAAGLAAGVYMIKSGTPVAIQSPASITEDASHDATAAAETSGPQPTQVASESRPEARPQADTNFDAAASDVTVEVSAEKTGRDLPAPKRVAGAEASSVRGESVPETPPSKAAVVERTPERPARKSPPLTTNTPAPAEAVRTRRAATPAAERTPVSRAPERSLPVSSPPSSAKKRVLQWP